MLREERSFLSISAFIFGALALGFGGFAILNDGDSGSAASSGVAADAATVVDITVTEFAMSPAMPQVPAGDVTLRITNAGTMVHDLTFPDGGTTSGGIQPGETKSITLNDLPEGDVDFICTIPGHSASGMTGMLMVGAAGSDVATGSTDMAEMSWQDMDKAMKDRALRFVEEPKGTFGGTLLEPTILADGTKQFELTAEIVDWEVEPGKIVKAWTYNGIVPGPEMKVDVGDKVKIILHNKLPESTLIHFHGVRVPNSMDGVDPYTQDPVEPGQSFTYEFTALEPAVGMYHSHHNAQTQVPNGLAGAFLIGDMPIPESLAEYGITDVDQSVTMVLNDAGTIGLSLNGKSFPATEAYAATVGDTMLVNYYNEGLTSHPMHMHQPVGWIIAKDGIPLKEPMPGDTISIAPGERYTVLYHFVDPGVWAWHCHILNHAEGPEGMFGMVTAVIVSE